MRKSLKGALLSGLVFPGYGQFAPETLYTWHRVDAYGVLNLSGINWSESTAANIYRT